MIGNRKAVSPVIATVILVAVAITVSVAVAYWMGGIAGQYTKFEKVEIQSTLATIGSPGNWTVSMKLKNTGTATANLIGVFVNDIEVDNYNATFAVGEWNTDMLSTQAITSGDTATIEIYISSSKPGTTLSSGTTVNIKVHSAGGMDYIKLVELV
jgi:flagellin-like protein